MNTIREIARAKVNLTLRVTGRRSDGYHELESLVVFADIGDLLTFTPGAARMVTVEGPYARDIVGENLVAVALERLAVAAPGLLLGSVTLQKDIPVAAGLGGGSADAAALIRAVMRANPDAVARFDWSAFAARLGADVPVCLAQAPAHMWGIGDKLRPVLQMPRLHAVLVRPSVAAPPDKTAQVFRQIAAPPVGEAGCEPEPLPAFVTASDAVDYLTRHGNDLTAAAHRVMPATADAERALATCTGCRLARMSGAGPSCFGLFDTREAARAAADGLSQTYPDWWVQAVTLG